MKGAPAPSQAAPPKPRWGTTDLGPRPFAVVPLPDVRVMPARCTACGAARHIAHGGAWETDRLTLACPCCGRVGTLEALA